MNPGKFHQVTDASGEYHTFSEDHVVQVVTREGETTSKISLDNGSAFVVEKSKVPAFSFRQIGATEQYPEKPNTILHNITYR